MSLAARQPCLTLLVAPSPSPSLSLSFISLLSLSYLSHTLFLLHCAGRRALTSTTPRCASNPVASNLAASNPPAALQPPALQLPDRAAHKVRCMLPPVLLLLPCMLCKPPPFQPRPRTRSSTSCRLVLTRTSISPTTRLSAASPACTQSSRCGVRRASEWVLCDVPALCVVAPLQRPAAREQASIAARSVCCVCIVVRCVRLMPCSAAAR